MNTARIAVLAIAIGAGCIAAYLASGSDKEACRTGRSSPAISDHGCPRRQKTISASARPSPPKACCVADLDQIDFERQLSSPEGPARRHHANRRLHCPSAVHCGGTDPRAETGQGQRFRIHGSHPADAECGPSRRKFRRKPAPAASSCRATASTSSCRSARSRWRVPSAPAGPDIVSSQTVLTNVRVLAIDQAPKEKEGQNAVLGKTATLEMTPDDVEILGKARLSGTLSLALRSIADGKTHRRCDRHQ